MRAVPTVRPSLIAVALALGACDTLTGRPDTPPPPAMRTTYVLHRDIVFSPPDWPQQLRADIYQPDGAQPLPAVLVIYGGGWHSGDRTQLTPIAMRLAERGYVAVATSYRLAPAYHFPAQLRDLQLAVRWMRANAAQYGIDPARIGAWGYSAGAHLAALLGGISPGDALFERGTRIAAVVGGGTPTDLRKPDKGTQVLRLIGGTEAQMPDAYRDASPVSHVDAGDPPVFLYEGGADELVTPDHATDYKALLDRAGVPNELMVLRGRGHLTAFLTDGPAVDEALHFLNRHLRDGQR
jgi:acetyl esterase/lipase